MYFFFYLYSQNIKEGAELGQTVLQVFSGELLRVCLVSQSGRYSHSCTGTVSPERLLLNILRNEV